MGETNLNTSFLTSIFEKENVNKLYCIQKS